VRLVSDTDVYHPRAQKAMMTMHAAKGLNFRWFYRRL
jgi:hypothetical protein